LIYQENSPNVKWTYRTHDGTSRGPCDAGASGWQVGTGYVLLPFNSRRRLPNLERAARIRARKIFATRRKLGNWTRTFARHIRFLYTAWFIWLIAILRPKNVWFVGRRIAAV